jgi:GT2 family glycosyltransferase/glycosyltransferase involved in cell wall biosynthesis
MDPTADLSLILIEKIAQLIIRDLQAVSVLHVGCGQGHLVARLRRSGIQAWGIDDSGQTTQEVTMAARPYCQVAALDAPLPQSFDVIVWLSAPTHLPVQGVDPSAETVIQNLCRHTRQVIFAAQPLDERDLLVSMTQPPATWGALFAAQGFYRDLEMFNLDDVPWVMLFKSAIPVPQLVAGYEERLWRAQREIQARRAVEVEMLRDVTRRELVALVREEALLGEIINSRSWRFIQSVQRVRRRLIPLGSRRERWMHGGLHLLGCLKPSILRAALKRLWEGIYQQRIAKFLYRVPRELRGQPLAIQPIEDRPQVERRETLVDIVVCVHNALEDVELCLASVLQHTTAPFRLILVDDGSAAETRDYLAAFAADHSAILLRNEQAVGYCRAANQGMRLSVETGGGGTFVILLNSDTLVTPGWVDRMLACAQSHTRIGVVGPLSNTASWQSIPELFEDGDWASNPLPSGMTTEEMGRLVAQYSGHICPEMKLLNGFCMLIRRQLIEEIGYFDEVTFSAGYGEEDDFNLRARQAGWKLALADDVYIYHAQSRSYSHQKRKALSEKALQSLARKHGQSLIDEGVADCRGNRVLQGIRARSRYIDDRRQDIETGRELFAGRRVLFVLPVAEASGGGNIVLSEASAMRAMGVDAQVFNICFHQEKFTLSYPGLEIPVWFGHQYDLLSLAVQFDAVVATLNTSVAWLTPLRQQSNEIVTAYYVQGFEPLIYPPGSEDYRVAMQSYTLIPEMILFTKTDWTRQQVQEHTSAQPTVVGPSVEIDRFRPRPRMLDGAGMPPLRIGAMVRPVMGYRSPELTMRVLQEVYRRYRSQVEILVFGSNPPLLASSGLPDKFAWKLAGELSPQQVARFVNELDIFVDFSSHQAMGLTALEAMACGAAVIVPLNGGAVSFAAHERNSLVIDTSSFDACLNALARLIEDRDLLGSLQRNALFDVCKFYPEKPALEILKLLFKPRERQDH